MHAARASAPSALALNPAPAQATSIQPDHSSSSSTECTRAGAPHCCHWSMTSAGNYFPYQWRQSSRPGARCMSVLYSTVLFVAKQGRAHRWTSERKKTEKGKGRECLCVSTAAAIQSSNSAALQREKLSLSLFILKQDTSFGSKIERALAVFNVQGDSQTLILFSCCSDGQGRDSKLLHCVHWIETFKAFPSFCNTWTATVREKKNSFTFIRILPFALSFSSRPLARLWLLLLPSFQNSNNNETNNKSSSYDVVKSCGPRSLIRWLGWESLSLSSSFSPILRLWTISFKLPVTST